MGSSEPQPACVCGIEARVLTNTAICRQHVRLELIVPAFPESQPGQFLALRCARAVDDTPHAVVWPAGGFPSLAGAQQWLEGEVFLRRPFSIADQWRDDAGRTHLAIISRIVGPGTTWLERLRPDEVLSITGPLGRGFRIPPPDVPLVLVGGGVGIPPLIYLARRLDELGRRDVTVIVGATTRALLPLRLLAEPAPDGAPRRCAELAGQARFPIVVTTDDGSCGMQGVVTDALRRWHTRRSGKRRPAAVVFTCGPEQMLAAVAGLTRDCGLDCQLSIERKMGCGLGACLSCVVRVRDASRTQGWRWALTCSDGPVFDREELVDWGPGP